MKKISFLLPVAAAFLLGLAGCASEGAAKFESAKNDPMDVRIYTLENGLKVYMSVYKDAPRIQTYIGVRAGSKNDPSTSTGLAHYFEHLMFKGTPNIGAKNYAAEKPLLDDIESLFELYRQTTDSIQRQTIYHQIDSISSVASQYVVSNEYDRMMTFIGAQGSNAWTSTDQTVYTENIPSNELSNWAIIQADRFKNPVIRVFHTELETVYEEKNRSLNSDQSRVIDTLQLALYPHHTYGTQSTLGTDKDLKSPSIKNIKQFHADYYVPNNMAICLSGDFNPDSALAVIKKNFGDMKPKEVPVYTPGPEKPITAPIVKNVYGLESDLVYVGFRVPGEKKDLDRRAEMITYLLYNSTAGLLDLNINQKQKMVGSAAFPVSMTDYTTLLMIGYPKEGQSMEEVKNLLIAQVDSIRAGNFGDWLLEAAVNNLKLRHTEAITNNEQRAYEMINAFTNDLTWEQYVQSYENMYKTTKADIMAYANEWLKDNYVVVYKHQDPAFRIPQFPKPTITPVQLDRNSKSEFFQQIEKNPVQPIEPVFADYQKDLSKTEAQKEIPVLYKKNEENGIFKLYYVFDMGTTSERKLSPAFEYLSYLGTSTMSPEKFKEEMFKLACSFNVVPQNERMFVILGGLSENMAAAMSLMENLFADAQPNPEACQNMIADNLKVRADNKLNYNMINSYMRNYGTWGPKSPRTYVLSNQEMQQLTPEDLIYQIKTAVQYKHQIWYYGPESIDEVVKTIDNVHRTPEMLQTPPEAAKFEQQPVNETTVFLTNYDSKQTSMTLISRGVLYDSQLTPMVNLYNSYFGDIAFQEMREARGLAYTVFSGYFPPARKDQYYINQSYIGTQNDKLKTAVDQFRVILTDMPESPESFEVSKLNMENSIRTNRVTKEDVLWSYYQAQLLGLDSDINKMVFEKLPAITFFELQGFHDQYIKPAKYNYCLVGNVGELDMPFVKSIGKVQMVTLEELFGY